MKKILKGTAFAGVAAAMGIFAAQAPANAGIIGHGDYNFDVGSFVDPGPSSLDLLLDGSVIFSIANPVAAVGSSISLATASPSAFAALVAVLRNNLPNDITTSAFTTSALPGVITVSDFNYSPPPTDDLQGVGAIVDIIMTINDFGTTVTPFPPLGNAYISRYRIDIDVEAIPVPAALVSAMSGLALMGVVAARRKRLAA